jgi:hypothetical protein
MNSARRADEEREREREKKRIPNKNRHDSEYI